MGDYGGVLWEITIHLREAGHWTLVVFVIFLDVFGADIANYMGETTCSVNVVECMSNGLFVAE